MATSGDQLARGPHGGRCLASGSGEVSANAILQMRLSGLRVSHIRVVLLRPAVPPVAALARSDLGRPRFTLPAEDRASGPAGKAPVRGRRVRRFRRLWNEIALKDSARARMRCVLWSAIK